MPTMTLRPRSVVEIVDAAFRLCRAHYAVLTTATALVFAPALVLKLLLPDGARLVGELLQNLLMPVADGAVIAIVSDAYLGRDVDAGTGLRAIRGRVGSLVWVSIGRSVLISLGLLLFVVPGMVAIAWTFALPMAIVLEGHHSGTAFTRARALARDNTGRILGALVLLFGIFLILMFTLTMGVGAGAAALGVGERAAGVIGDVALIGLYPLVSVGGTLLYYDLRIRKEGFDLEVMARELTGEAAAPDGAARAPVSGTAGGGAASLG